MSLLFTRVQCGPKMKNQCKSRSVVRKRAQQGEKLQMNKEDRSFLGVRQTGVDHTGGNP